MSSLHPLDAELNLPPEQYSHTLSERVASASAFNGFNQTVEIIKKTTTAQIAKRQVEEIALSSACNYEVSRVLRRFYLFAPFRLAVIGLIIGTFIDSKSINGIIGLCIKMVFLCSQL